jgi:2,4-dienoyl-CoA reductase-like NADH-dependent reductase (Old Yellow Enzyme family)
VASGWGIDTPQLAEGVLRAGQVDLVKVGRASLADPHWPYSAATELGVAHPAQTLPVQYSYWLSRYQRGNSGAPHADVN